MKIALVVPHMFMHKDIYPNAIFAPGSLAIDLCKGLNSAGVDITFFSPGYKIDGIKNINADLSLFEEELQMRGYGYLELLQKHPLVFSTMARQIQSELISQVYQMANDGKFDLVHIYANEEELALAFANLCNKPVLFTHHEPFNFLTKYRSVFPKYKHLNWISISMSQQNSLLGGNFVANIYNGIDEKRFKLVKKPKGDYFAYFGRIIEPKGVHIAIKAAKEAGVKLKIAGKHYSGFGKESYWEEKILPEIDGGQIEYIGFLKTDKEKQEFLGNAKALLMPSIWDEPFGMVLIEAMACGTPVIGLNSGAIGEVVEDSVSGFVIRKNSSMQQFNNATTGPLSGASIDEYAVIKEFVERMRNISNLSRMKVRIAFESQFTLERMVDEHIKLYEKILEFSLVK